MGFFFSCLFSWANKCSKSINWIHFFSNLCSSFFVLLLLLLLLLPLLLLLLLLLEKGNVGQLCHLFCCPSYFCLHRLVGLVVKISASRAEDPVFESRLRRDFSWLRHTSNLNIGTPVVTLPGAWRYRVGSETGWPGVSILRLDEVESLICNFYLSVTARLSRCVPEIHWPVAGTLSNQQLQSFLDPAAREGSVLVPTQRLVHRNLDN